MDQVLRYFWLFIFLGNGGALLWLQTRAFVRHRELCFVLLCTATVLALLYYFVTLVLPHMFPAGTPQPWWYYPLTSLLLLGQVILGLWGTANLFRVYALLRDSIEAGNRADNKDVSTAVFVAPYVTERTPQSPRSLTRSIQAAVRWLSWRQFDGRSLDAPDFALALLALLSAALWIGLARIGVGPKAEFSYFAVQVIACKALGLLAIGWVIRRTTDPRVSWRTVLFVLLSLTVLAVPVHWGINHFMVGIASLVAVWGFLIVQMMYLARALRVASGYRQAPAVGLSLVALLIGAAFASSHLDMGPLWYVPESEEQNTYTRTEHQAERLLMSQPARIDAAVASMAARSGDTSMYLVGFAGVGEQKVFTGEVSLAAKVIGDRYGTKRRTLLLVNDQRDLESQPLASVTGLKLALADIGKRMDREHDVLILAISSHGSEGPAISVSNGGIPLNDLTGKDLKEALDDAGIRWRVVIISACYAGAFIPYLRDERSIVITAAAADRTSFGCGNDRDLTYFGEAFYRDALPSARSFEQAFSAAKAAIAKREASEHITPSKPQAYFGAELERVLLQHSMKDPVIARY